MHHEKLTENTDYISRSEKKRQFDQWKSLALQLVEMSPASFSLLPFDEDVLREVQNVRDIKSHTARRRQLRFLTRYLSEMEIDFVTQAVNEAACGKLSRDHRWKKLEKLRDQICTAKAGILDGIVQNYPQADMQKIRNLQRNYLKEKTVEGMARSSRAIYQYLRELDKFQGSLVESED